MGMEMDEREKIDYLDQKGKEAYQKYLDRRAIIFIEEAIANYNERHGIEKTCKYLEYMLDYFQEFKREEN